MGPRALETRSPFAWANYLCFKTSKHTVWQGVGRGETADIALSNLAQNLQNFMLRLRALPLDFRGSLRDKERLEGQS